MRALFDFASRGDFQEFVDLTMRNPAVQGITVDVDRTWLMVEKLRRQLPPAAFENAINVVYDYVLHGHSWSALRPLAPEIDRLQRSLPRGAPDWSWLPPWWDDYYQQLGRFRQKHPFLVRVCLLPWNREQESINTERWDFPIAIEHRPQARLCSTKKTASPLVGGVSIGVQATSSGTLGGIIEDRKGKRFALTCAHLAALHDAVDQPAQSDDPHAARKIGSVQAASTLLVSSKTTPCSPKNPLSRLNKIDAALVELDSTVASDLDLLTLGKLSRIFPEADLNPGDTLYFVGKESGPSKRELVTGGLNVVFRFTDDGVNFYSFENTFQVEWPTGSPHIGTQPIEDGDSGAWLCCPDGSLHAWTGVALGCHRDIGYALFAEPVAAWVDRQLSHPPLKIC